MARKFWLETLGCQMNVFDSQRIAELLGQVGYSEIDRSEDADIIVVNTCAVRENAATKLYGHLGQLAELKREHPSLQIAVGGCLAQAEGSELFERSNTVDVIFGTNNVHSLPKLLELNRETGTRQIEILDLEADWTRTENLGIRGHFVSRYVTISVGCDQQCSFCIVPSVRGPQIDRPLGEIVAEVEWAFSKGAKEVTLLGQNVNAYGKKGGSNFAEVLEAVARTGISRIRFMSPHPGYFSDSVIETMAKFDNIMPSIHFPLQSGSSRVLKEMNRGYNVQSYLAILKKLRDAIPHLEVTSDIIVGFPGETEADHGLTCEVIEQAEFLSAFTFIYSPRPGTRAAGMNNAVTDELIKKRFREIVELQETITVRRMRNYVGQNIAVMLNEAGKKDAVTQRISGRNPQNILTHIDLPEYVPNVSERMSRKFSPGQIISATVTYAAPHHLIAQISEH